MSSPELWEHDNCTGDYVCVPSDYVARPWLTTPYLDERASGNRVVCW